MFRVIRQYIYILKVCHNETTAAFMNNYDAFVFTPIAKLVKQF